MSKPRVGLYLMSARGLSVLTGLLEKFEPHVIAYVVVGGDVAVAKDFSAEIIATAEKAGLPVWDRKDMPQMLPRVSARFAAGWRWLLPERQEEPLVVFHDSVLPRYRGFAPLVSALIAGDRMLGVTALLGAANYDTGSILRQEFMAVEYPLRIAEAIEAVRPCYARLSAAIWDDLVNGSWEPRPQNPSEVSYSLWRDEEDYLIDWSSDAEEVRRFVDATGSPYRGAATFVMGRKLRILAVNGRPDVLIVNRTPGKIVFLENGYPIVVCGRGLVRVEQMVDDTSGETVLPWTRFRTRFTGGKTPVNE